MALYKVQVVVVFQTFFDIFSTKGGGTALDLKAPIYMNHLNHYQRMDFDN